MESSYSPTHFHHARQWAWAGALAAAAAFLAGCGMEGYTGAQTAQYDQYGRPIYNQGYPAGQPVYTQGYPANQPIYTQGYPVASQPGYAYGSGGDYMYYPDEEVYYSPGRREYIYRTSRGWTRTYQPPRNFRDSSFSVHLSFGDDPVRHHDEIEHRYPRHWRPHDGRDWDHDGRR